MLPGIGVGDRLGQRRESGPLREVLGERLEQPGTRPEHEVDRRPRHPRSAGDLVEGDRFGRRLTEPLVHGVEDPPAGLLGLLRPETLLVLALCHDGSLADFG